MALVNTGLQIEIKGIQKALTELAELDQRQDSLSLSADQLLSSINGVNLAFKSIQTQAGTVGKAFDKITINVFSQNVQQASTNLDGFSTKVQATVPHLQNIANASRDINKDKLLALSNVKIDANSFQQASTAIDLLANKFNELNTTLNGGVINTLERFVNTLNTTGTNTGQFGNDINQLALGLQKLEKIKDLNTISENFNKFLSVLRRLRDIEVTGSLAEIGNIGPAIRSIGAGLKDFSKTTASLNTKSINDLFNVLRDFNNLNITNIAVAMPTFANSLTQLAEAFRRFSSGEPGEKLPASLNAVTDALSKLTKVFDTTNNTTVDIRALGDNMAAVAPHIEQFANAMRKFTTGKEIDNLPQRMKDIREAFKDIRDAFNFKDIDVLAPKIQALAPALEQLAVAFRSFTTGTNIKNLSTQISTIITALREFTRLDLSSASNDIGTLAPAIKALAEAFRSFTTGTNIDDLPKRVQNIVNSINQLKGLNLEGLASSLKETTEPLSKFFSVFRLFSGSEKFDNLGKRFSELAQALQQLKKLNLAQFSKELQSVSTGLNSLVKASQLVNSQNINKLGAVFAQVRKEAQANTIANRALSISYNLLVRPITATASGLRTLATAIVKVPFNIFIGQLKLLKALFIDLPIGVVTKTFRLLVNTVRLVIQIFTQLAQRIKQIQDTFKNIITVVKLLLLPLTLLIETFKAFINIGAKVASIFTAFKVNKVSEDVKKLSTNLTQANKELNTTASTANRAESELRQTDQQFEQVADSSKRAASGINLASVATRAIQVGQVALLGVGIASATKKILAFVAASKSLQVIGTVFQRLNIVVQQFGRQIVGGAFEATAEFEQLRLQIQSLLAKDFVKLGKAGSVKEALGLEELNTTFNETLAVIKQLAIQSPFENADITKIFQMAQSFGFMREEALDMTAILTDASAALGLSGDDAREVAKVFGQIKSLGKVLAGDVNQLAQRGINVKTIFKDVGLSMEEVQKGALSADDAIKLILGTLKRDFGGAAARATNTLQGLASTFNSLRKDTLRTLFTPLFEGLKPFVSELLGTFQNDEFLASIERLGNILRDNVLGAILAVAKPLVAITTTFINLPEPIQRTVILLARMAATALAVSTAVAVIQAGLIVFGTALTFIFNPISLIVGGLITLATTLVTARKTISDFGAFIGGYISEQFNIFISYFPKLDEALTNWVNSINKVGTDIGNVFNAITSVVTGFFGVVNTPVPATGLSTVPTYLDSITLAFNNTTSEVKDFGTTFGATGKTVEANVGTIADKFIAFEQTAGLTLEKIKTPFDDFLVVLDKFAKNAAEKILFVNDKITLFGDFIGRIFTYISTSVQPGVDAFNAAFTTFGTAFEGVTTLISNTFNGITTSVSNELGALGTFIGDKLNNLGDFFTDFLTDTTDFGGGLVDAFAQGILATLNVVADALLEIAKLVTFWLEPGSPPRILPNIDKWGEGLILAWIDGMGNGVQQAFATLGPVIQKAASGVFTVFTAIGNFTFGTIINSIQLFGQIFTSVFFSLVAVGQTFLTQIALIFNFIANSFVIILDPALSFKDKFIRVLNEVGFFISGTFVNIGSLVVRIAQNIINALLAVGQFVSNEFVTAFNSIKLIFPQLDSLTKHVEDFSNKSLTNLETFGKNAAKFFADLLDTVTGYGSSLISAFSDGIIASVSVVSKALSYLGNQISYWLAPGSPPRLLPEIDKWGQAAADEFLGGFSNADFDTIEDFGDTAEKILKNLDINENIDIDFQGLSQDFAEALASGGVSDNIFSDLRQQVPQAADELTRLAKSYFEINNASTELEQANNKVAESQARVAEETEKIKAETEAYDKQISDLEATLSGIETASTYDAEIKQIQQLQEVIGDRYSSEYEKTQAQRKIDEIRTQQKIRQLKAEKAANEVNLRAAEEQLKADEEAAKQKENNVSATQEELDALKARLALAEKFNQGSQAGTGGGSNVFDKDGTIKTPKVKPIDPKDLINPIDPEDIFGDTGAIDAAADGILSNIKTAFDNFKEQLSKVKKQFTDFFDNLKYRFGQLRETFKPVTDALGELFSNTTLIKGALVALGVVVGGPIVLGALTAVAGIIGTIITILSPLAGVLFVATGLFTALGIGAYILGQNILQATGLLGENSKLAQEVIDDLSYIFTKIQDISKNFGSGFINGLFKDEQNFFDAILGFDTTNLTTISTSFGNLAAEIVQEISKFQLAIFKSFTGILAGKNPIDTFLSEMTGKDYTGTFQTFATNLGNNIYDAVQHSIDVFRANIASSGLAQGIVTSIVQLISEAFSTIGTAISGVANFDLSTIQFNIGGMTLTGGPELGGKLATLLGDSFKFLENIDFSTPKTVITSIFTTAFDAIKPVVQQKFIEFLTAIFGVNTGTVLSTLDTLYDTITGKFQSLFDNIEQYGVGKGILQTLLGDNSDATIANFTIALGFLDDIFGEVGEAFSVFVENIDKSGLLASIENLGTQLTYAITELLKLIGPLLGAILGTAFVTLLEVLKELPDIITTVVDFLADLLQSVGDLAKNITDLVTGQISFGQFLKNFFGIVFDVFESIGEFIDRVGDSLADILGGVATTLGDLLGKDWGSFVENWDWWINLATDLIATALVGWVLKLATNFNKLLNLFTGGRTKALTELDKAFISIGKGVVRLINWIKSIIPNFTAFLSVILRTNPAFLAVVAGAVIFRDKLSAAIKFITDKFTQFKNFLFGDDGVISKISAIGTTVTDPFASLVITNPFAFIDEFLPIFKLGIEGVPEYFTGLLDNVVVFNPFEALNTFLFGEEGFKGKVLSIAADFIKVGFALTAVEIPNPFQILHDFLFSEEGFVSRVLGIGSDFVATASEITGIKIPDPFLALKTTLDNIEAAGPLIQDSIKLLVDYIKGITINDVFEAISASLTSLVDGAQNLLNLDLSGFSKVFAPVTEQINSIKQQFDSLVEKFRQTANLIPGINLGDSELTGVEVAQEKIKTEFGDKPVSVSQKLDLLLEDPELSKKAYKLLYDFEVAYSSASGPFGTNFAEINKQLIRDGYTADDVIAVAKAAGLEVSEGFAEGFTSDTSATTREARKLATNTLLELKEALGIKSPSTEARDKVGVFVVEGILQPFAETELITPAIKTLVTNIISQLTAEINNANATIKTNITSALLPSFQDASAELSDGFAQRTALELSNADIPVNLKTDYTAEGEKYGTQLGQGFISGLDSQLSKTTGIQGIGILFNTTLTNIKSNISSFTISVNTQLNSFYSLLSIATNKFLSNFLKLWRDKFNEILDDIIEEFIKDFTDMVEEFYELLLDLTETLFDDIINELNSFILSVTNNYSTFLTNIVSLTRTAITNIINEFKRLTTELVPIINQAINDAEAEMRKIIDKFKGIGKDAIDGFIEEVDKLFEKTEGSITTFLTDFSNKYAGTDGELYKKGNQIGIDFITGWINGTNSKAGDLLKAIGDIVDAFLAKVTTGLGIQSPSKVMYRLANYVMDGFIFGIRNKFSELTNTMGMVTSIVSNGISPNIRLTGNRSQQLLLNYADSPLPMYNKGYQKLVSSNTINNGSSYNISNNYNMTVNTKPDKTMNLRRQFRTMEFIGV